MPYKKHSRFAKLMYIGSALSMVIGISSLIMISVGVFSLSIDTARLLREGYSVFYVLMPVALFLTGTVIILISLLRESLTLFACSVSFFMAGLLMGKMEKIFSLYSSETVVFVFLGIGILLIGVAFYKLLYREAVIGVIDALGIVAFLWFLVPLIHSLPLVLLLRIPLLDAFFESVMGFTGTGLTVFTGAIDHKGIYIPSVDELSMPILLWRSIIQWVGGIGVVVMSMAIIAQPSIGLVILAEVEGRLEKLEPTIKKTAIQMFKLYIVLTIISFALFYIAGLGPFEALCQAFTGISTAGFSTRSDSFASMSLAIKIAGMIVMILGASNFHDMYIARKRPWAFLRSVELRAMLITITLALLASIGLFRLHEKYSLIDILFQITSALTTTGWQSVNLSASPIEFKVLLIILIFVGGSIFSTAGSVKILRYIALFKYIREEINKMGKPRGYQTTYSVGRYSFSPDSVGRAALVMFLYFFTYHVGLAFAFKMAGQTYRIDNLFFEVASALGNIGLSTGVAGASLPAGLKLEFIVLSIMGRLEIFPLIILIYKLLTFRPSRKRIIKQPAVS